MKKMTSKEMIYDKLESCPFCNGKGKVRVEDYYVNRSSMKWYFRIECAKCGVKQPNIYEIEAMLFGNLEIKLIKDERKKAIDDWNTRKANSQGGGMR